jgi:hypothetical protein
MQRGVRIHTIHSALLQRVPQVNLVGDNYSHGLLGIVVSINTQVLNEVTGLVDSLETFEGDVLAT